jgi:hypothetical protein
VTSNCYFKKCEGCIVRPCCSLVCESFVNFVLVKYGINTKGLSLKNANIRVYEYLYFKQKLKEEQKFYYNHIMGKFYE